MNRFITESEVEEAKQKRAQEWEEARKLGRELPDINEPVDTRPLYERLKEQKDKKQEDFEEQFKFKNMIYKGLNQDDASFLSFVSKKQAEIDDKRFNEESEELQQYRTAVESVATKQLDDKKSEEKVPEYLTKKNMKSQSSLLASAIVKKKRKPAENAEDGNEKDSSTGAKKSKIENDKKPGKDNDGEGTKKVSSDVSVGHSLLKLTDYPSSSSDEEDG